MRGERVNVRSLENAYDGAGQTKTGSPERVRQVVHGTFLERTTVRTYVKGKGMSKEDISVWRDCDKGETSREQKRP